MTHHKPPKDATKWSITQCYETQPLLLGLLNVEFQTSHLASVICSGDLQLKLDTWDFVHSNQAAKATATVSLADASMQRHETPGIIRSRDQAKRIEIKITLRTGLNLTWHIESMSRSCLLRTG